MTNWRKFWLSGHSWRKVSLVGRDETMSNKFCLILFPRSSCPKLLDHIFLKGRSRVAVIAYLWCCLAGEGSAGRRARAATPRGLSSVCSRPDAVPETENVCENLTIIFHCNRCACVSHIPERNLANKNNTPAFHNKCLACFLLWIRPFEIGIIIWKYKQWMESCFLSV